MQIQVRNFEDLGVAALYDVLRLRADVFVVEQECAYLDPDGIDLTAVHVLGRRDERLVAYARVHPVDDVLRISRVVTARDVRGTAAGHEILRAALAVVAGRPCFLNAQDHLRGFYAQHGFVPVGETFLEDGIPHVRMERAAP